EAEIYSRTLGAVSELELAYGGLWTECQRCQGSLHQDVLCTSRDCPIFYRRKKVQKDLNEAVAQLERFNADDW
ncbi:DNA polymerase delta catalytic subunit, partial [Tetrabaena socialis]